MNTQPEKAAKPLRVAVTGGSGRIGKHVVKALLARGHSVVNLDRREAQEPLARLVYLDLRRREIVQPVLEQADAVCHLAEIPNVNAGYSPDETYFHNTNVGAVVLQTAADLKLPRVVYTSSSQVYACYGQGQTGPARVPFDETLPLQPRNAYGLGKLANELYAQMVSRQSGLSVAIFRFPGVFDWEIKDEDNPDSWHGLRQATGPNEGYATYVHATDAAQAYVLAIENPRPGCEAYHFSADEVFSGIPLRERMKKNSPDYPLLPPDWPNYKSPMLCGKAKDHFGWTPKWNIVDRFRKKFGKEPHE